MAFSDHVGFGGGGGQYGINMHDSNFVPLNPSAFDLHRLHENVLVSPHLMNPPSFQLYGNTGSSSRTGTFNGFNPFDGNSSFSRTSLNVVTRKQVMFGGDGQQNMSYFTTAAGVEHPPVTLPHGQFGVVVQRSVVETVTYRPIQPQPLPRVSYSTSPYYHPKNCITTGIKDEDIDNYDIKPHLLHFPPAQLPQNNNNSEYRLQIEGQNMIPDDDDDDFGHKNRSDEYKTRSLKHKKYGPYTCPRCKREIGTSQSFASHMRSHYSTETEEERKMRMEAKYKKKNLRVALSGDGLTLVPQEMEWTA